MAFSQFSFLLLLSSFLDLTSAVCPDLWISVAANCYKVSPDPMTWHQAHEVKACFCGRTIKINYSAFCSSVKPPGGGDSFLLPGRKGGIKFFKKNF